MLIPYGNIEHVRRIELVALDAHGQRIAAGVADVPRCYRGGKSYAHQRIVDVDVGHVLQRVC